MKSKREGGGVKVMHGGAVWKLCEALGALKAKGGTIFELQFGSNGLIFPFTSGKVEVHALLQNIDKVTSQ